jgi:hypothetical protein
MTTRSLLLVFALLLVMCSGCTHVNPWERGTLSEPMMRSDWNSVGVALDDHIYFSREAASGGRGVGGGGCGCN